MSIILCVAPFSFEKAKILYNFGADIHWSGNGNWSLICEDAYNTEEFLRTLPFTEEDFLNVFKCKTYADRVRITQEILRFYPHYKHLITLENVILKSLQGPNEVDLKLCLHFKDQLGLKADSEVWLPIIAKFGINLDWCSYQAYESHIDRLRNAYGQEFTTFFELNKSKLLHLLVEKGRTELAWHLSKAYNISWKVLDEAGNCAFLKLLVHPQETYYHLVNDIDVSSIGLENAKKVVLLIHDPELIISGFTLRLICKLFKEHNIDMFKVDQIPGETLLDRVLKLKQCDDDLASSVLSILRCHEKALPDSQAKLLFKKCPEIWFDAIQHFPTVLPANHWELRDEISGDLLIEITLKKKVRPNIEFIIENSERFHPHMELIAIMELDSRSSNYFFEFIKKVGSDKYLNLLKRDSIRTIYTDEEIFGYFLDSRSLKLVKFVIEELGISPNTLIEREFPLRRVISRSNSFKGDEMIDYLTGKGAIAPSGLHDFLKLYPSQ